MQCNESNSDLFLPIFSQALALARNKRQRAAVAESGQIAICVATIFVDEFHHGRSDMPRHELQNEMEKDDTTFASSQRGAKPAQFNFSLS